MFNSLLQKGLSEKFYRTIYFACLAIFVGVLAFFISYNAQWLVGDDAIVIRHTGWGHFFNPTDTVSPESGRFYPLAYFAYNILYILGLTSVNAHFILHTIFFLIFATCSIWVVNKAVNLQGNVWKYVVSFSAIAICIQRGYISFLDGFSTIWIDYTLLMTWSVCSFYVHANQSKIALVIGLIALNYLTYCLEANFVLPLCYSVIGLWLTWKSSTRLEKAYLFSIGASAIVFLLIYFFTCFIHIEHAYDGSHGSEVTFVGNAIKMLIAQKVLWLGLLVLVWRLYCILIKDNTCEFWDTMILSAFGFFCGCAILKLNWVMYYSMASILMLPALVHFILSGINRKIAVVVFLSLALFMCRTLPKFVYENQCSRKDTTEQMETYENLYKNGQTFYWYEPSDGREWSFDMEICAWLRESLQTQLGWQVGNEDFKLNVISEFNPNSITPGVYMVSKQNEILFPGINEQIINAGEKLVGDTKSEFQSILIR